MHLRSVELQMPDRAGAVEFLTDLWGLMAAGTRGDTTYLRPTAARHYAIAVTRGPTRAVVSATLIGSRDEVEGVRKRAEKAGLKWRSEPLTLTPSPQLIGLVRKSQELAAAQTGDAEGES